LSCHYPTNRSVYRIEEYLPESIRAWVHTKITDLRILLIDNGILPEPVSSGGESRAVQQAREAYQKVTDDLGIKAKNLGDKQSEMDKDYGPDDIFRALKGTCVSSDSGEYTYEHCYLGKTTQKSKKGGASTNLGTFVRIDTIDVDEDVPADGKGLGRGARLALRYENGQHCWNGPNRRTTVVLGCAEKEEIWKVFEEEKCVYRVDAGSPAACEKEVKRAARDEL
jgi:protein kinase C substrate 80K-H